MLAGVCGGLAEWLGWDVTLVRILYVVVSILSAAFPGILVYVVLWIVDAEGGLRQRGYSSGGAGGAQPPESRSREPVSRCCCFRLAAPNGAAGEHGRAGWRATGLEWLQ